MFFSFSDAPQGYDCALRSAFYIIMSPLGYAVTIKGSSS